MRELALLLLLAGVALSQDCPSDPSLWDEDCVRQYLDTVYEVEYRQLLEDATQADWTYNVDINAANAAASSAEYVNVANYDKEAWTNYFNVFNTATFTDPDVIRRVEKLQVLGESALSDEDVQRLSELINGMLDIYNTARVCPFDQQGCDEASEGMPLEPDLEAIMSEADPSLHSYEELQYVWEEWRANSGALMIDSYVEYLGLENAAAALNGLDDASQMWLQAYTLDLGGDDQQFRADLEQVWQDVRPLYLKLHAYIRYKYREAWGTDKFEADAPIPAFLTGNMWAQEWQNTFSLVKPYPDVPDQLESVDDTLIEQGYTVEGLMDLSRDFYTGLGLRDMSVCYDTPCAQADTPENKQCHYDNPMVVRPDWDVTCHASAWDMYHQGLDDYRLKMCTEVNLGDLVTIHHEMGHIQYFMQYESLNLQYRDGANPGFHEAIGDTMALAVQTPAHLQAVGLLDDVVESDDADVNFLMQQAMERVMFLPFGYLIDQYRWALFDGSASTAQMNQKWWELRETYQGLAPPTPRGEEFFDAGAKYHVAASVPYIRYFVAHILEYSFYRTMCLEADQYDPLDPLRPLFKCDFSAGPFSDQAGAVMESMLQAGSSRPWPDLLLEFTGNSKTDASALLEYFSPLEQWLDEQIDALAIPVGWTSSFGKGYQA